MRNPLLLILRQLAKSSYPSFQMLGDRLLTELLRQRFPPLFAFESHPPSLCTHVEAVRVPSISLHEGLQEVGVQTALGRMHLGLEMRKGDPSQPLIVTHHGIGEMNPMRGWNRLVSEWPCPPTVVGIRAAGHESLKAFKGLCRHAQASCALMASSMALMEGVCRAYSGPLLISGVSLGGLVAQLHASRFGWDHPRVHWVPIIAGPDLAHCLTQGNFRRLVAQPDAPDSTDMDLPGQVPSGRVHPLLGLYDLLHVARHQGLRYRQQGVFPRFARRSHIGLALDAQAQRQHLQRVITRMT